MSRQHFTVRETRDKIEYLNGNGVVIATVSPGTDVPSFILIGLSRMGHTLKDAVTGEYLCGNLDELLEGGA